MNRRQMDRLVGVGVGVVVLIGLVSTGQQLGADDPMMGQMGSVPVIHFLGPLLVSLLVAGVLIAAYALIRDSLTQPTDTDVSSPATTDSEAGPSPAASAGEHNTTHVETTGEAGSSAGATPTISQAEQQVLDVLPEDETRILRPVIESPGLTQTAVADRANYSRSKVSQTVTDLEERGLLYRERQGRTYRVYPADDLGDRL